MTSNQLWMKRLHDVECSDSTYRPTANPLVFSSANGSIIRDVEGREYIDLCAGFGVLALGHNHHSLRIPLSHQDAMVHGMGDVYASTDKIEFLEALSKLYRWGPSKVALALSGSQAVEIAIKTTMLSTGKCGFICFKDSYHGLDLGVLSVTYREDFRKPFQKWLQTSAVEFAPFGCTESELELAKTAIENRGFTFAGVIVEPIQGRAGAVMPPEFWLEMCVQFARKYRAVSILDDIFAGMGRAGALTNCDLAEFDLVCLGKAIGGGFPISACVGSKKVMDAWPECTSEALHTGTFFGHPLSCRVGLATIAEIARLDLVNRSARLGVELLDRLSSGLKGIGTIRSIRGKGLMTAIEFLRAGAGAQLMDRLRLENIIALASGNAGQCLSLTPALNIPEDQLWDATERICRVINSEFKA